MSRFGAPRRFLTNYGSALVAASLALLGSTATAQAADPHDGTWTVTFSVQEGTCSQRSLDLHVSAGSITSHGVGLVFHAAGHVNGNGSVQASLSALGHTATAQGQLGADAGSGTWSLSEFKCSGQWTAKRIGT